MIRRRTFVITGAAVLGLTAAGLSFTAVAASRSSPASRVLGAQPVTSVITLEPHLPGEVFAPPSANASPALTAHQAAVHGDGLPSHAAIPPGVSVQLGLFTLPVGPESSCGNGCSGDTFVNGIAYSSYRVLAYGFARSYCSDGSLDAPCTQWDFIDANTGKYIAGLDPAPSESVGPRPSPSA